MFSGQLPLVFLCVLCVLCGECDWALPLQKLRPEAVKFRKLLHAGNDQILGFRGASSCVN